MYTIVWELTSNFKMRNKFSQFIRNINWPLTIIITLAVLSSWAILAVELDLLWKIPTNDTPENPNGWNRIFLGLSYGYITGLIIYIFTVWLPTYQEKKRLQPIINDFILNLGVRISNILTGLYPSDEEVDIDQIDRCKQVLSDTIWNNKNPLPIYRKDVCQYYQAFYYDYKDIQDYINNFIICYKAQLSSKQILLLEQIKNAEFMSTLSVFVQVGVVFPPDGGDFIVQSFTNDVLLTYQKLLKTLRS